MAVVNVAFDILMDPVRRANYDQTGAERVSSVEEQARKLVLQGLPAVRAGDPQKQRAAARD
jgi:DnaJ-class molecular chaperone